MSTPRHPPPNIGPLHPYPATPYVIQIENVLRRMAEKWGKPYYVKPPNTKTNDMSNFINALGGMFVGELPQSSLVIEADIRRSRCLCVVGAPTRMPLSINLRGLFGMYD